MEIPNTINETTERKEKDGTIRSWVDLYMPDLPRNSNESTGIYFSSDEGIWMKKIPFTFQGVKRVSKFLDSPRAGTRFLVEIEMQNGIAETRNDVAVKLYYLNDEMETFIEAESARELHGFLRQILGVCM